MSLLQKPQTLKDKLHLWNGKYPFDLAWRIKHNIQFGSSEHKSMDFISMLFNLIQEKELDDFMNKGNKELDDDENQLFDNKDVIKMTKEEIKEEFENLDIDNLNIENLG
jgi:hypothetical protein